MGTCAGIAVAALLLLAIAATPGTARANHAPGMDAPASERRVGAAAACVRNGALGADNAADHAAQRAVSRRAIRRWRKLSPAERRRALRRSRTRALALARATAKDPATEIGRWTRAPFGLPTYAINLAMLPTGKLLFWSYPAQASGRRPAAQRRHGRDLGSVEGYTARPRCSSC
jgi:hypothetical protein